VKPLRSKSQWWKSMARVNNVMRCESCPKWVRSLKGTMFCDECLRLNEILASLWKPTKSTQAVTADDRA
jgi:hypothetical protein